MQRMAIDWGKARIGLALGALAPREFGTIKNNEKALATIVAIVKQQEVDELIIGDPVRSDGQAGTLHKEIDELVDKLKKRLHKVAVIRVNEAFTTAEAESELRAQGVGLREMKERVDQYAAKLMLIEYNGEHPVDI